MKPNVNFLAQYRFDSLGRVRRSPSPDVVIADVLLNRKGVGLEVTIHFTAVVGQCQPVYLRYTDPETGQTVRWEASVGHSTPRHLRRLLQSIIETLAISGLRPRPQLAPVAG